MAKRPTPIGVPNITPINKNKTNLQFILFQILGIIKKLATISNNNIIGTISFAGKIKESNETLEAENPNPLNPLTNEANRIIKTKNKFYKLSSIIFKYSISSQYCHWV